MLAELLRVCAASLGGAKARQPQSQLADARPPQDVGQEHDALRVERRIVGPERLRADLRELPVAPRLRRLVPEEGTFVPELDRLGSLVHPVLDVGAAEARSTLRPQSKRALALVLEGKHLLLHD